MKHLYRFFISYAQSVRVLFFVGLIGIVLSIVGMKLSDEVSGVKLFENMHWTIGMIFAALMGYVGYRQNRSRSTQMSSLWFFLGLLLYALGQVAWDIQVLLGYGAFPSPSDIFYLLLGPAIAIGLIHELRTYKKRFDKRMFVLDILSLWVAVLSFVLILYLPKAQGVDLITMSIMIAYPVVLFVPLLMVLLMIPTLRLRLEANLLIFIAALIATALSWMHWNSLALEGVTQTGSWFNVSFSVGILFLGLSLSRWRLDFQESERFERRSEAFLRVLPLLTLVVTILSIIIVSSSSNDPFVNRIVYLCSAIVAILAMFRQSRLLEERDALLEAQAQALKSADVIQTILQTVPLRIFWKDKDLKYLGCNDLFAQDAGFKSAREMIGKDDFMMGWHEQAELYRADDMNVIKTGRVKLGYEEHQTTPEGGQIWLRTSKVPLIDTLSGERIGVLGVYEDITQQHQVRERLKFALEGASDGLWDWNMQSNEVYYSPRWFEMLGYKYGDFAETLETWETLIHPEDKERTLELIREYLEGRSEKFEIEFRMKHKEGHWVDVLSRARLAKDDEGNPLLPRRLVGTHVDISARKQMEKELRQTELYQRALLDNFPFLVWLKDIEGRFLTVNKPLSLLAGFKSVEEMSGLTDYEIWPHDLAQAYRDDDAEVLRKLKPVMREEEVATEGIRKWVETYKAPIVDRNGELFGTVGFARDISERKEMERRLHHIAHYDSLTNLPNRLLLTDRLQQAIAQSRRSGTNVAVIYLDLDGFKEVNDAYGHEMGDKLLIELTKRMRQIIREGDTLSRLGGDEFVLILPDSDKIERIEPTLERLLLSASKLFEIDRREVQVSASIGVSFYPQQEEIDADQLIRQADQAMYQAKQTGKNRYYIFDPLHDRAIRWRHENIERIKRALTNEEFTIYYQPKVNMRTGKVVGAEALIRWQHPQEGLLAPGAFLSDIQNNILMAEIGSWVLESVMKQIEAWRKKGIELPIGVNIDSVELEQADFVQRVKMLLERYKTVNGTDLEFEILETSALKDITLIAQIITQCREFGINFALDDFGTGYSSLTYLKRLPVKTLKIDQSFVIDLLEEPEDLAIVEGIYELADTFGKEVIAEGVESEIVGTLLLLLGCERAQGYAIAKPMSPEAFESWLSQWQAPRSWMGVEKISKENQHRLNAIVEHRTWIKRLCSYLSLKTFELPILESCRFSQLFGQELQHHGDGRYAKIDELHERIHSTAARHLQSFADGNRASEDAVAELMALSDALVEEMVALILQK